MIPNIPYVKDERNDRGGSEEDGVRNLELPVPFVPRDDFHADVAEGDMVPRLKVEHELDRGVRGADLALKEDGEGGALALGAGGARDQRAPHFARLLVAGVEGPAALRVGAVGDVGAHVDVDVGVDVVVALLPFLVERDDLYGPETVEFVVSLTHKP